jgi:hypothetical protein
MVPWDTALRAEGARRFARADTASCVIPMLSKRPPEARAALGARIRRYAPEETRRCVGCEDELKSRERRSSRLRNAYPRAQRGARLRRTLTLLQDTE